MYIVCREAQEKKMKAHVNGWGTIERQLSQLGRKQGELARLLQITPAAVSQVKKGVYLLNPKQLEKIATFLQFDAVMRNEFYTELFNARLLGGGVSSSSGGVRYRVSRERHEVETGRKREIPLGDLELLADYVAPLETMRNYLLRKSPERYLGTISGEEVCALRVGAEFEQAGLTSGSLILIESGRIPDSGGLSLVGMRDGHYLLREFIAETDRIVLRPMLLDSGAELELKRSEVSDYLLWVHPVLELTLRFCK